MEKVFEVESHLLKHYIEANEKYLQIADKYNCSHDTVMQHAYNFRKSDADREDVIKNEDARKALKRERAKVIKNMFKVAVDTGKFDSLTDPYAKAKKNHPEAKCLHCGRQLSWEDETVYLMHLDMNVDNTLLTNLVPLCQNCYNRATFTSHPTVSITKSFSFDASHYLPFHEKRCKFLHGHTYHMEITLNGPILPNSGMVIDFGDLKQIVNEEILDKFDHGFINQEIAYPTCEFMTYYIWGKLSKRLKGIHRIKLWETDGSYCELTEQQVNGYIHTFNKAWIYE